MTMRILFTVSALMTIVSAGFIGSLLIEQVGKDLSLFPTNDRTQALFADLVIACGVVACLFVSLSLMLFVWAP